MPKTILVVDDDPAVLQAYGRLLGRLGHRIVLSGDSERVRNDPDSLRDIDLLILDERMPKTSGLELLDVLSRRPRRPPSVILISAFLSPETRDRATRLGVADVIEKPVDTTRLLASVRAALEGPACPRPEGTRTPRP